jgi:hypothetical protein
VRDPLVPRYVETMEAGVEAEVLLHGEVAIQERLVT